MPTRSALMTGRFPIRSGNHTIALGGNGGGIVKWERTIGAILSGMGQFWFGQTLIIRWREWMTQRYVAL